MKLIVVLLGLGMVIYAAYGYPCICQTILDRVCGNNGVTYANNCTLNCASGVTFASNGPCGGGGSSDNTLG